MPVNLVQASRATGRSKSTVLRAIRRGLISAARDETTGGWLIEPVELHRVWPPVAPGSAAITDDALQNHNGTDATAELREVRARLEEKDERLAEARDQIADLRRRLDAEAEERRRLTMVLADMRATPPPVPAPSRRWWPWARKLSIAAAAWVVVCGPALAANDGNELLRMCLQPDGTSEAGYCLGYVSGIDDALQGGDEVCVPEEVTRGEVRDVVVRYLQANQRLRYFPADLLVRDALAAVYPCRR